MIRAELERRPLLLLFAGLALGISASRFPLNLVFLAAIPFAFPRLRPLTLLAVGFAIGVVVGPGRPPKPIAERTFVDSDWYVASLPRITPLGHACEIERDGVRLELYYGRDRDLCPGSILRVRGVALPPQEGSETYFASRGMVGRVTAEHLGSVRDGPLPQRLGCAWRGAFRSFAQTTLPASAAAEVSAICFNAGGLLDDTTMEQIRRTGTIHLIAVSGLQVVLLAQAVLWLLRLAPIPRWAQIAIVAGVLVLYAIATGLHPSVIRCAFMWLAANAAYIVRREPDWLSALSLSSGLFLLWSPGSLYEMGFLFSNLVVLFLSIFRPSIRWKRGFEAWAWREGRRGLRTAGVALLVVAPLTAYFFGFVSLVSAPANLLVTIAIVPTILLAMSALPLSYVLPWLAVQAMHATIPFLAFTERVLSAYGGDGATLSIPEFSGYWLVVYFALLAALWRPGIRQP